MGVFPIVIDTQPSFLAGTGCGLSLLQMPIGPGTLYDEIEAELRKSGLGRPRVLPLFPARLTYERHLSQRDDLPMDVIAPVLFGDLIETLEPSDWLLIIDVQRMPADLRESRGMLRFTSEQAGAVHLVSRASPYEVTREYVQLDGLRQVCRIGRLYDGITWNQIRGVSCSLVSVAAALHAETGAFASLAELRQILTRRGVASLDLFATGGTYDLSTHQGVLTFVESRLLAQGGDGNGRGSTSTVTRAASCAVSATARLSGPVVLQEGVVIEDDAVVIGPSVIGSGSRVGRGSVVAQCVVMRDSDIEAGATIRHCLWTRGRQPTPSRGSRPEPPRWCAGFTPSPSGPMVVTPRQRSLPGLVLKRVVDGVVSAAGLALLSPLLLIVAGLIKLTSRGPVLYGDQREGRDGEPIRCLKFRTMVQDADHKQRELQQQNQVDGPQFKIDRDPRVTRLGTILRETNVDELPQLINVLRGEMSLIGPRPSPFRENQICVPWRKSRLSVRPGITGLWQICRHERSAGDFHQWIYYDMLYVKHQSTLLDLKILAGTFLSLATRRSLPVHWLVPRRKLADSPDFASILTWSPTKLNEEDVMPGSPRAKRTSDSLQGVSVDG